MKSREAIRQQNQPLADEAVSFAEESPEPPLAELLPMSMPIRRKRSVAGK